MSVPAAGRRPYPVLALGLLTGLAALPAYAFLVLSPDIARALGVGIGTIAGLALLQSLVITVAALPIAAAVRDNPRRALLCVAGAVVWSTSAIAAAFVTRPAGLAATMLVSGVALATIGTLHAPLIADSYHPAVRMRALSAHRAVATLGSIVAPLAVAVLVAQAELTWRGVLAVCGTCSLALVLVACGLRDPGPGRSELARAEPRTAVARQARPGTFGIARSLLAVATLRRIYAAYMIAGLLVGPLVAYLIFNLEDRWALDAAGRGAFLAGSALCTALAVTLFAKPAEALLQRGPAALIGAAWRLVLAASGALAVGSLSPVFGLMSAGMYAMSACLALAVTAMIGVFMTLAPPQDRPHAAALAGVAAAIGGLLGVLLLQGVDERVGIGGAMALLVIPGVLAALVARSAAPLADADLDSLHRRLADADDAARARDAGAVPALLACRGLTVYYDSRAALDGVDLEVGGGELVTLLGTNGAGKSTLLRALAGLVDPAAGTVRYDGHDVTWLAPERRALLGVRTVIGGRAVLGPLTVEESLRVAARAAAADAAAVVSAYEAFPLLGERRHVLAAGLSGGEQQMLGVAQALLVRPRLLLVDELSIGLAPAVVDVLVARMRSLSEEGVAVIVADQALAVARALGGRALFLDRGVVRFDGDVETLARRADLLRPVFLTRPAKPG